MRFILLGSGAVRPDLEHWGPGQVVQVKGRNLLFDCGRGASMRLVEAGIPLESVADVFFTHHHYDHNCDFPYLFLTSWVLGRRVPMQVVGPRGTRDFCDNLFQRTYREDIESRRGHPNYSLRGEDYEALDILDEGRTLVFDGFVIKTTHPVHKQPVIDNLAYRIEADGKAIVVVGDTTVCPNLMELAAGADLLVHECSFPSAVLTKEKWVGFHTDPRELGTWAKARGVRRLLIKHFCLRPGVVTLETLVDEVRSTFGREGLIVGKDLMAIEV